MSLKGDHKGEIGVVASKKGDLATVDFEAKSGVKIELDYLAEYRDRK